MATLLACVLGRPASAEVLDRVLAVVAGGLITLSDVNAAYDLGLVTPPPSGDRIRDVLARLVDRELELAEVTRYAPPEPSAAEVDEEVQKVRARFATAEAFDAVLARSGIDLAHLRETLRENLRIRTYLAQRFAIGVDGRQQVIDAWVAGLRRRADVIDLYVTGR
jgi:predicted CopG family antitoxin